MLLVLMAVTIVMCPEYIPDVFEHADDYIKHPKKLD